MEYSKSSYFSLCVFVELKAVVSASSRRRANWKFRFLPVPRWQEE
jgi:hypothetical protein